MKLYDLQKLLNNPEEVNKKIEEFLKEGIVKRESSEGEIKGHMEKAEHNLNFIKDVAKLGYSDWAVTGCYYACYHAVLALIMTRGYFSKSHLATLCIVIKESYKKELSKEDIELLSNFLDYQDVLFYVESKNKRENATYSTKTLFDKQEVEKLRIKAALFVDKLKGIIKNGKNHL